MKKTKVKKNKREEVQQKIVNELDNLIKLGYSEQDIDEALITISFMINKKNENNQKGYQ